ncbi:unnamed protein product [Mytilus coruscus]|uniref:Uncharacterized protein n=1 Tax=Mytilus coruscus TaxID=42192 RepID=A0A6J8B1I1_MYTCO|nr:unnamed protein product [Mytilus coruscus]
MLANQQMQMMMQQQQMMQQSFLHSTAGFCTYPHMAIPRHIPPPPGYVPNPPPYPQFNAAQNLQHQNVNQSYNSQHIQRDLRVNLPQPKPSVSQTDRCHRPQQRKNHKKSQIPPRLHNNNMRQISEEVLTKHKHQQNENMTKVQQAQSKEGSPLFNLPGDIPCDNSADSSPHDGQHPMQTIRPQTTLLNLIWQQM